MKRLILIVIAIATVVAAYAQAGLQINSIFGGKYSADSTVTETMMSGSSSPTAHMLPGAISVIATASCAMPSSYCRRSKETARQ